MVTTEIKGYSSIIGQEREREPGSDIFPSWYKRISEPPPGFLKPEQLQRWEAADKLFIETFSAIMAEGGIGNHSVERTFKGAGEFLKLGKHAYYAFKYREGKKEAEWDDEKPYKGIYLNYHPGGQPFAFLRHESLLATPVALRVPQNHAKGDWFWVDEATEYMQQYKEDPTGGVLLMNTIVGTRPQQLTQETVRDVFELALATPREVRPYGSRAA